MSECERIAQVAHNKWANVSDLLRSLMINEQIARFFEWIAHLLFRSQKASDNLKKIGKNRNFVRFYSFLDFLKKGKASLIPSERSEQIAQVAQDKWATVSDSLRSLSRKAIVSESLRSLSKNEWMSESLTFWANRSFAHLFGKNEQFAPKFNERIPKPVWRTTGWCKNFMYTYNNVGVFFRCFSWLYHTR